VTYVLGQRATLRTTVTDPAGQLSDATVALAVTAPDGTVSAPTVTHPSTGVYTADVTFTQPGDWLVVWTTTGAVVSADFDQVHVIAPALRIVGLAEVKEHGNITGNASDRELLDFIGTAEQIIESIVGVVVPRTITDEVLGSSGELRKIPVLEVLSVVDGGVTLGPSAYTVRLDTGRVDSLRWGGLWRGPQTLVTYRPGRASIEEAIRWAAKELTVHLWRTTQTQRGGRARRTDEAADLAAESRAGYALPNRVLEALQPFALSPVDVG
jgi:hypothetical protein